MSDPFDHFRVVETTKETTEGRMARKAAEVTLSDRQQQVLTKFASSRTEPAALVQRSKIVLMSSENMTNVEQADVLSVHRQRVRRWRLRWASAQEALAECETIGASDSDLEARIREVLADLPRSGTPPTFEAEQVTALIALACEEPEESGLPVSHWTPLELATEAIGRGIFESISPRHVDRLLKEVDLRPHKSKYWLTSPDKREDPAAYQEDVEKVSDTYLSAPELHADGIHIVCTDEKTGMQALERTHTTKPTRPGLTERREFEYIRHGTQCLIANFEVATGKIIAPTLGETRTEEDFVEHVRATVEGDPDGTWIFVVDQLNTHKSAGLVELVAQMCDLPEDLGRKGSRGILKSMKTRKKFLEDESHRIRFVYTPRHCSWLNQVEIWFSILVRRLLKRASFTSLSDLRTRVTRFIEYFNTVLAKPFKWTFTGRPLKA
jgi:transposase